MPWSMSVCVLCCLLQLFTELDEFIATIDSRQDKKSSLPGLVAKKVRRVGEPSPSSAPADAPTWAVAIPGKPPFFYCINTYKINCFSSIQLCLMKLR